MGKSLPAAKRFLLETFPVVATNQDAAVPRETLLMFVDKKMYGRIVCEVEHHDGTICDRPHAVPSGVLWFGRVENRGDFWSDLKQQRKAFRRKLRKWERDLRPLKSVRPAPAFAEYMRKAIAAHHNQKPLMQFKAEANVYRNR